jgi:Sperm tail
MSYSLKQAAEATGKTKPTILRAIQLGKISAKKDEHGEWQIDPAELHRVYKPVSKDEPIDALVGDTGAQRELELLREMLADRDKQIERIMSDKDRQIESLNRRLEAVDEERRTTLRQLTALLTDQRAKPASEAIPMPPPASPAEAEDHPDRQSPRHVSPAPASEVGWWRRMVGGK